MNCFLREDALALDRRFLADTKPEEAFWFCNGSIANNIYQLMDIIQHTDEGVYAHHTTGRNDFTRWIQDVLGDDIFVHQIVPEDSKELFLQKLASRIKEIEERIDNDR